ncbi:MAG TPA: hypothetical protein DEA59_09230, partial [Microbacterium sp.]|nr:hypothetical protein [Microbacterium sp.]
MNVMDLPLTRAQYVRWRTAVFAIFLASGLSIATWASRVPDIKIALGIENSQIGLLLLGMGVASIVGLSLASVIIARFGTRRGMFGAMLVFAAGVVFIGLGTDVWGSFPVVIIGLALFGFGNGAVDVTSRANLQIRGVTEARLPALQQGLGALGLLDDAARQRGLADSTEAAHSPRGLELGHGSAGHRGCSIPGAVGD